MGTAGTRPVRIIDSLFVRAADDTVRHCNGHRAVTPDEFKDRLRDSRIGPNIPIVGEPPLHIGPFSSVANLSDV